MRTKPQTVTTWRSADLRRWTADARRRRRTPTLAYFRARAQAETLAELRSADEALDILRRAGKEAAIRQFIARTMDDNIQSVADDFENQGNVVKVGQNATDGLNLQKIGDGDSAANRQRAGEGDPADNLQKVETSAQDTNRQTIDSAASIANQQLIGGDGTGVNLQAIDVDADGTHREAISPEVRAQNIQEVAEEVNHRLDRFEVAHSQFLQIGRTQKFTDAFVPIEHDASDLNRQLVDESFARLGLGVSLVDTSSAVLSVPESEAAGAPALASQDAAVVPAGSVAKAAPPLPQKDPSAARTNRRSAATKEHRFGQAGLGLYRGDRKSVV